jgi:hypothetical protein
MNSFPGHNELNWDAGTSPIHAFCANFVEGKVANQDERDLLAFLLKETPTAVLFTSSTASHGHFCGFPYQITRNVWLQSEIVAHYMKKDGEYSMWNEMVVKQTFKVLGKRQREENDDENEDEGAA